MSHAPYADYQRYPRLDKTLPPLVKKQRRLAKQLAPLEHLVDDEKKVRADIDVLLVTEGFGRGEGVTCNGYDVVHRGRNGNTSLNAEAAAILFTLGGVDPEFVDYVLTTCLETADPSKWAEVKPSKGASVRT